MSPKITADDDAKGITATTPELANPTAEPPTVLTPPPTDTAAPESKVQMVDMVKKMEDSLMNLLGSGKSDSYTPEGDD